MFPSSALYHIGDLRAPPVENLAGNLKFVEICGTPPRESDGMDDGSVMENVKAMLRDHGETICPQNGLEPACLANNLDVVRYLLELEYRVSLSGMVEGDTRRVEGSISLLRAVCKLGHADVALALMEMGEYPVQPDIECLELSCAFLAPDKCGLSGDMQRCVLKMLSPGASGACVTDIRVVEIVFGTRCIPLMKRLLELCDSTVFRRHVQLHRDISSWAAYSDASILRIVGEKFGFSNGAELAEIASVTGDVDVFKLVCQHSSLTNMETCILTVSEKGHLDLLKVMLEMVVAGKYRLQAGTLLRALYFADESVGIEIKELLKTRMRNYQYRPVLDQYNPSLVGIASCTGDIEMFKMAFQHSDMTKMAACVLIASEKGHLNLLKVMLEMIVASKYQLPTRTLLHAFYKADIHGRLQIRELLKTNMASNRYIILTTDVNVAMKIGEQSCMEKDVRLLDIIASMDVRRYLDYNKFLCLACEYGCEMIVRMLLESEDLRKKNKIDVNCSKCLPMIMACRNGHVNLVQMLVDGYNATFSSDLLMYACKYGQLEVAKLLISRYGVEANACDGLALIEACTYGHAHVAVMLIKAGADPRSQDQLGLDKASSRGHIEIVEIFLELEDISFSKAFKLACQNRHVRIMKLLWIQRVNDCKSCGLQEIFEEMCANGAHVAVEYFMALVSDEVNMDYNRGFTMACRNGHLPIVKLLIDQETAVEVNACGGLPLVKACKYGHIEIVKLLLAKEAYIRRHDFVLDDIVDADIKKLILESNALRSPVKKQRVAANTEMKMDTEMIPMIAV